ncbi:hypothetical protein I4U23_000301 [Adineta vaga]|nr:hypothetical protein I4U23_000301 [Adineta vaga]
MNNTNQSFLLTNETIQTTTSQSSTDHNKILIITLSIILPILISLVLLISFIICYRRRLTKLWFKTNRDSCRLDSFDSNLPSNINRRSYLDKKHHLSYRPSFRPHTETIVYNQINSPSISVIKSPSESFPNGEINAAFDEYSVTNEQQSRIKSHPTTETFPTSTTSQTPVSTITSEFVQAIATHRLALLTEANQALIGTATPPIQVYNNQSSEISASNSNPSPPTVLLFSQRTLF